MSREDVQTNLRLPADLKERLQQAAEKNNRSLSAEVTHRLESSFIKIAVGERELVHRFEEHLIKLQSRVEILDMRREMIRNRIDGVSIRTRLVNREIELLQARPDHPDNDAMAKAAKAELAVGRQELKSLKEDLDALTQGRDAVVHELAVYQQQVALMRKNLQQADADGGGGVSPVPR